MKLKKIVAKANREHLESYFAKVNWNAHLVPVVRKAVVDFAVELKQENLKPPFLNVLSEDALNGHFSDRTEEIWGDSISINFGARPLRGRPTVAVKGRTKVLSEQQASLVFSQAISGSVVALIYPPSSELAKPLKPCYVVDFWRNPGEVRYDKVRELLQLTVETDIFSGVVIYPNKRGTRLLAKLQAKDQVLANGGSRLWVWVKYTLNFTKGVLRLYGIGKPV